MGFRARAVGTRPHLRRERGPVVTEATGSGMMSPGGAATVAPEHGPGRKRLQIWRI
ncbi:WD repeat-containing protein 75 [Iris pallida]|uniref:WD repeat-containing protein 75 n=1 Tax=Iris pallida TaxID=29817 RepID=A0AAX6DRK8_IRIPA|nr:WD repeat-containing protein 75 [Iris pallida]